MEHFVKDFKLFEYRAFGAFDVNERARQHLSAAIRHVADGLATSEASIEATASTLQAVGRVLEKIHRREEATTASRLHLAACAHRLAADLEGGTIPADHLGVQLTWLADLLRRSAAGRPGPGEEAPGKCAGTTQTPHPPYRTGSNRKQPETFFHSSTGIPELEKP